MPLEYRIDSGQRFAYVKGVGKVTAEDIMTEGARMFAESEWANGFNILCDYREITDFNLKTEDIRRIISQDRDNELLFDQSKCAIVAVSSLVFGLSRMWETLSENTKIETTVFKNIEASLKWLDVEAHVFQTIEEL